VAATESNAETRQTDVSGAPAAGSKGPGVLLATLMLPGLASLAQLAQAESAPEQGVIAVKAASYRESQPGWERIKVQSPQVYLLVPLASQWALEGTWVGDSVSGATPRLHTSRSGATPYMSDHRSATDLRVTRYFSRAAVSVSVAGSDENDYRSRAQGVEGRWSSEDNNRTWSLALGHADDVIDTRHSGGNVADQRRKTLELRAGVTQVLGVADIAQLHVTRSQGRGYFNDPYKDFDQRPDQRNANIALLRWNHDIDRLDATVRSSYRYYNDSFGVRSHTVGVEWVQSKGTWTITPGLRYYNQSAASFYFDPRPDATGQANALLTRRYGNTLSGFYSADPRLSAFGAVTASIKLAWAMDAESVIDVKLEAYRQGASLKPGGGSPYLDPLRASFVQLGYSRKF
jgi:hypothetical protein